MAQRYPEIIYDPIVDYSGLEAPLQAFRKACLPRIFTGKYIQSDYLTVTEIAEMPAVLLKDEPRFTTRSCRGPPSSIPHRLKSTPR